MQLNTDPQNAADGRLDTDDDGFSNRQESLVGQDPTNATRVPARGTEAWTVDLLGRVDSPAAVGRDGTVYVADSGNYLIRRVSALGEVTTLAGRAGQMGSSDGVGNAALFDTVVGAALDGAGNIYVTDAYFRRGDNLSNNTVRKVRPDGAERGRGGRGARPGRSLGRGPVPRRPSGMRAPFVP